jgi:hypothetical protein
LRCSITAFNRRDELSIALEQRPQIVEEALLDFAGDGKVRKRPKNSFFSTQRLVRA